ncbi:hypothetical protein [Sodalis sp. CWE]|uniref:hypothetical protein n=1 Tax=Sodalis sp. CWE TaxID=2803816 RepID=UPI001C7DFD39|nr:hypothetical protein [Sodalis sp. CWE]MBX4181163.1 hypothetical protein [Sodalis sp. CWE]
MLAENKIAAFKSKQQIKAAAAREFFTKRRNLDKQIKLIILQLQMCFLFIKKENKSIG